MAINLEEVASLSRQVVSAFDQELNVVSVSATEGGGDRAEILVTVGGCHQEPCIHLVNVSRGSQEILVEDLRAKLAQSLQVHRRSSATHPL
jgi:hypothetical protein